MIGTGRGTEGGGVHEREQGDRPDHRAVLAAHPLPALVLSPDLVVLEANAAVAQVLGTHAADLVGRPLAEALAGTACGHHPDELAACARAAAAGGGTRRLEGRAYGDPARVLRAGATPVPRAGGAPLLLLHLEDVTDLHALREHEARQERRRRLLDERSLDLTLLVGADRSVLHTSSAVGPTARALLGDPAPAHPLRWGDLPEPHGRHDAVDLLRDACAAPAGRTLARRVELVAAGGRRAQMDVRATNLLDDPDVGGVVMNVRDVTEQHDAEERLQRLALQDPLTGLPNRRWFLDALAHAVGRSARSGLPLAVLLVDLDDFKVVNDTLGHPAGDRLLVELSQRMRGALRPGDAVARLGGDEFVVLAEELHDPADAVAVARRLSGTDTGTYALGEGLQALVTLSVGVSTGRGALDPDALLAQADTALYEAKRRGRARVEVFDPALGRRLRARLNAHHELGRALEQGGDAAQQLRLLWQPVARTADGALVGAEALVRWHHPERGVLAPDAFLPLAEETGLMAGLCAWVLDHAMAQAAAWERLPGPPGVWVNLAAQQLTGHALLPGLRAAVQRHGVDPARVRLEVSERLLGDDVPALGAVLREVTAEGFLVALDDFGAGNTALSWLQDLPLDLLKLDRRFTARITEPATEAIARAVLGLAPALGIRCVGEGVETQA